MLSTDSIVHGEIIAAQQFLRYHAFHALQPKAMFVSSTL
jgi:hypothetical protein